MDASCRQASPGDSKKRYALELRAQLGHSLVQARQQQVVGHWVHQEPTEDRVHCEVAVVGMLGDQG